MIKKLTVYFPHGDGEVFIVGACTPGYGDVERISFDTFGGNEIIIECKIRTVRFSGMPYSYELLSEKSNASSMPYAVSNKTVEEVKTEIIDKLKRLVKTIGHGEGNGAGAKSRKKHKRSALREAISLLEA